MTASPRNQYPRAELNSLFLGRFRLAQEALTQEMNSRAPFRLRSSTNLLLSNSCKRFKGSIWHGGWQHHIILQRSDAQQVYNRKLFDAASHDVVLAE